MCQFITAIFPSDADTPELAALFRAHGRTCSAYVSVSLAMQIGSTESSYITTVGHCDCGTPLGGASTDAAAGSGDGRDARDIEIARLRRKGWSQSKIERSLVQRDEAKARPRTPRRGDQLQMGLDGWCALIREALALPRTAYIGLLHHDYSGDINDEEIALQERQVIRASGLDEAKLASMHVDTIYEFRR